MAIGLFFVLIGAFFSIQAWRKYPLGSAGEMGPGYFPFWLGVLLVALGLAKWLEVVARPGSGGGGLALRIPSLALVVGSILLFGLALERLGLLLTVVAMVLLSSAASHEFRWRPALLCGLVVSVFCALLFVVGLGLQMPLWPDVKG